MSRSDYFKALDEDHFGEFVHNSCPSCDLPVISLHNIKATVFEQVVYYLYQDTCKVSNNKMPV